MPRFRPAPRFFVAFLGALAATAGFVHDAQARTQAGFERWVREFRGAAVANGVPGELYDQAFVGVRLNEKVVELDQRQPEFTTPIWEYLNRRVSPGYIEAGQEAMVRAAAPLAKVEATFAPPKSVVAAIWGIESRYGEHRGTFNVIEALATLAYEGRRSKFGRQQLIEALKILKRGDTSAEEMRGSWAGAMGHTQFIPTSYQAYAVDLGGDGRRDIWSDDPTDALASTANYLTQFGWRKDEPWGFQVTIPPQFDYSKYIEKSLSTKEWAAAGLTLSSGGALPTSYERAKLLLPAGARGPAFLALDNYRVILRYNNANAYALAVLLLAERLEGRPPRALAWPENDRPLNSAERKELQELLGKLGFNAGPIDGIIGSGTKKAIRGFQVSNSMIADGYASALLLEDVRRALAVKNQPMIRVAAGPTSNGDVREIQGLLRALGYRISIDGKSGPKTTRAIQRFVNKRQVPLDPEPSQELLTELRRAVRGE